MPSSPYVHEAELNDSHTWTGPVLTLMVRGFTSLESVLDHYFLPKFLVAGDCLRVVATRRFRRLPAVLQIYLKRGEYDCCSGLLGLAL